MLQPSYYFEDTSTPLYVSRETTTAATVRCEVAQLTRSSCEWNEYEYDEGKVCMPRAPTQIP